MMNRSPSNSMNPTLRSDSDTDQPRSSWKLVLEDGVEFRGKAFSEIGPAEGEVVFNTAMTGYVETLTDPSYRGQILVCTYPLIGSYGVPAPRNTEDPLQLQEPYESSAVQVQGLIVQHYIDDYSHYQAKRSLAEWMRDEQIPAVTGIDTRNLTKHLRERGTMLGWLFPESMGLERTRAEANRKDMREGIFREVTPPSVIDYPGGDLNVMLVDVGAKDNLVRSLQRRGARVRRVPWFEDLAPHADWADGVLISNGPGDPGDLGALAEQVRKLLGSYSKPIFGVCLGNQILALAAGGKTFKLPYGHRGVNQPVHDLLTRRSFITSQNHGYAVDGSALPSDWEPWFVNVNDGTNEGIRSRTKPFFSVQFHPEARPGPEDTGFLFDDFLRLVGSLRHS
jgi:carbamoyl-phosphate synthase small subunit